MDSQGPKFDNVCVGCGKSYRQWGNLTRHIKFECGMLPRFGCTYCEYRSKRKGDVKKHIFGKHPGEEFKFIDNSPGGSIDGRRKENYF